MTAAVELHQIFDTFFGDVVTDHAVAFSVQFGHVDKAA